MDIAAIKANPAIKLKPNAHFENVARPYNYQKKMALTILRSPRLVIGDDVGLGKTLEILISTTYLKAQREDTRFLIFTEKTALVQWVKEYAAHSLGLEVRMITADTHVDVGTRIRAMMNHRADIVLTSYSMIPEYWKYLKEGMGKRWVAIFDEPDGFKNTETRLHTEAYELVNGENGASRIYASTATIVGNRLSEAFGILRIVAPGTLGSLNDFHRDFCKLKRVKGRLKVVGYKNLDKFRKTIEPVFYGRLQDDPEVAQELPEVLTKDMPILMSESQSKKVVEAMDRLLEMPDGEVKQLGLLPGMTMSQILCDDPRVKGFDVKGAKTEALIETITGSLNGERIVVFSKYRSVIDLIEESLRKRTNYPILRITGKESWEEKEAAKNFFMSDEEGAAHSIMLLTKAGRRAINLQRGGHLFFFDLPWAYDDYRQLIGRLKRTGSTFKKIAVYRMLAVLHPAVAAMVGTDETIDHYTLNVIMEKYKLWQAITGDAETLETGDGELTEIYNEIKTSYRKSP